MLLAASPHAGGTAAPLVFLLGSFVATAWALVAVHAWHRAARRRAALGAAPGGGASDLIWMAPFVAGLGAVFWIAAGSGSDPALVLDGYLADWRAGRNESGVGRFAEPPRSPAALRDAWRRQEGALRNAIVGILAVQPSVVADPERPFDDLRWVDLGSTAEGGRSFGVELVRQQTVRGLLFGRLPTTTRSLVTVRRLGTADLVLVAGPATPFGTVSAWRLERLEIAGVVVGS